MYEVGKGVEEEEEELEEEEGERGGGVVVWERCWRGRGRKTKGRVLEVKRGRGRRKEVERGESMADELREGRWIETLIVWREGRREGREVEADMSGEASAQPVPLFSFRAGFLASSATQLEV